MDLVVLLKEKLTKRRVVVPKKEQPSIKKESKNQLTTNSMETLVSLVKKAHQ